MSYSAPTGLTGTPSGFNIPLTWGPSYLVGGGGAVASGYDVYRNGVSINAYTGPSTIGYTDVVPGAGTYTYNVAGWGYVIPPVLLLHFDGTNGSTTFTDSSPSAVTMTAGGAAAIETSSVQFGTGAANIPGGFAQITSPTIATLPALDISTGDFTFELWVNTTGTNQDIAGIGVYGVNGGIGIGVTAGTLKFYYYQGGGWQSWSAGALPSGTWTHIALVRQGNVFTGYLNGVGTAGPTYAGSLAITSSGQVILGVNPDTSTFSYNGLIDEFRMTKFAVYTANFTPPSAPFSSGTLAPLLLLHFDGTNGQTTTVDSSPAANTVLVNSSFASLSTSAPEFGTASLSLPASNKFNSYAVAVPFAYNGALDIFKTNAWTIECFAKVTTTTFAYVFNYGGAQSTPENASFEFTMSDNGAGATSLSLSDNGMFGTGQVITQTISTPSFAWHHIAVVLNAGVTTVYFDGVALTITKNVWNPTSYSQLNASPNVIIGSSTRLSGTTGPMFIDEFRVSAAANYTANFTPPVAPFTIPGSDISPLSAPYVVTIGGGGAGTIALQAKFVPANDFKAIMVANPGYINPRIYPPQVDTTVRVKP